MLSDPLGEDLSLPETVEAPPSPKVAAIREYIANGYALIPCRGKIPLNRDWGKTPKGKFTEKELAPKGINYGVVLSATDLVIDIDPRNFKPNDNPVKRLVADLGLKINTFTVKTGGGGSHVYLKKPADIQVVSELEKYPGVEFKSVGRQVIGPGSIHPETNNEYVVINGSLASVMQAPESLLTAVKKTGVPYSELNTEKDQKPGAYLNDEATQTLFVSYLKSTAPLSVEGQNGDNTAYKVAAYARDLGLAPATALELLLEYWNPRCQPPWGAEELNTKVVHSYKYAKGKLGAENPQKLFDKVKKAPNPKELSWNLTKNGAVVRDFYNLLNYLSLPATGLRGVFGFNEFTGVVEFINPAPWHKGRLPLNRAVQDDDIMLLKGHLAVKHGFEMTTSSLYEAVIVTAKEYGFHPVREYLEGLKWDGIPRLDKWLTTYLGAPDTEYVRAVSRKVLCAAVMRVFHPGCVYDHILVLEGGQGIGKTSVCRILGGEWAGEFPIDPHSKDTIILMQGKWIVELAELEFPRKVDADAVKAFISRPKDKIRMPFGRLAAELPRQCIFIASKNPNADGTYLSDDTGNRRWWPVPCHPEGGRVDFKAFKAVRKQLFAEAVHVVSNSEEKLSMDTPELEKEAALIVSERHADDPWTERVASWLSEQPADRSEFVTARDVFIEALGGIDKQFDHRSKIKIASVMKTLGYERVSKRIGSYVTRGYAKAVPKYDIKVAEVPVDIFS